MTEDFLTALQMGIDHLAGSGERYITVSVLQPRRSETEAALFDQSPAPMFLCFCAAEGQPLALASLKAEDETWFGGRDSLEFLATATFTVITQFVIDMDHVGSDDVQWLMLSDLTEQGPVVV